MKCENCDTLGSDHSSKLCVRCRWEVRAVLIAISVACIFTAVVLAITLGKS